MLTAAVMTGCASSGLVHDKEYLRAVSVRGIAEKEMTFSFFSDETMTVSASGKDIEEALEKAELKAGKPVFTGYTELVIVENVNMKLYWASCSITGKCRPHAG